MVFRKDSVTGRLKKLEEILANLRDKEGMQLEDYKSDLDAQWIVERGLEIGSSAILDIGNHILAGAYGVSVDRYEKVLEKLRDKKVVSNELYGDLKGLGGFRNILVHGYLDITPELMYQHYKDALNTFPQFIAEIERWLDQYDEK